MKHESPNLYNNTMFYVSLQVHFHMSDLNRRMFTSKSAGWLQWSKDALEHIM